MYTLQKSTGEITDQFAAEFGAAVEEMAAEILAARTAEEAFELDISGME